MCGWQTQYEILCYCIKIEKTTMDVSFSKQKEYKSGCHLKLSLVSEFSG
jgi:hypothetical protein